ncbi:RNA polymerase sigma factor [Nonomuraea wenchangensis]|uniref:RNA polymerase sigma factor n=3 Tax=Nonomuraea wenchangensis TaxID=568860 RepID=UPI00331EE87D
MGENEAAVTWGDLPREAQDAIGELLTVYGAAMFDYCRTGLPAAAAGLATCSTMLSAYVHAHRLAEEEHLRAWLYALARAHRTTATAADVDAAGVGCWRLTGTAGTLLPQALAALEQPQAEVLDLAVRHDMSPTEIALIFDIGAMETERLLDDAALRLQQWVGAVAATRSRQGCPTLAPAVTAWTSEPTRHNHAHITRHVHACPTCTTLATTGPSAADLLASMPRAVPPAALIRRWEDARPLAEVARWRPDGFPAQIHALHAMLDSLAVTEPAALPRSPLPAHSAHPGPPAHPGADHEADDRTDNHDEQKTPPAAQQEEFRAWERRTPDAEFWARREDEADPEARLSLRALLPAVRVSIVITAVVGTIIASGAIWSRLHPPPQNLIPAAAPATIALLPEPPPDLLPEDPPTAATTPVLQTATTTTPSSAATTPEKFARGGRNNNPRPHHSRTEAPDRRTPATRSGPQNPLALRATSRPAATPRRPTDRPTSQPAARQLPKPPPPTASLSPSSLILGTSRSGTISLSCTGECRITSVGGIAGTSVSGTTVAVTAPASRPGCTDTTESATLSVNWSGTTTGDGRTTTGTTAATGTLTAHVSWAVKGDKGTLVHTGHGDYWSNCPNG